MISKDFKEWLRSEIAAVRAGHGDGRQVTNENALAMLDELDRLERELEENAWGDARSFSAGFAAGIEAAAKACERQTKLLNHEVFAEIVRALRPLPPPKDEKP